MPTTNELLLLKYLQNAYPHGIRDKARDTSSLIYKYDLVRAAILNYYRENVQAGIQSVVITTASENGVSEWENFLGIGIDASLGLSLRRANVLSRLLGSEPTIATIKTVAAALVGGDAQSVSLHELWQENDVLDDVWTYEIWIYAPIAGDFDESDLRNILERIQPAHCVLVIVVIPVLTDSMSLQDATNSLVQLEFRWQDEGDAPGQSEEGDWTDALPFFVTGAIWDDTGVPFPIVP